MKITLCGSVVFIDQMNLISDDLKKLGHEVFVPYVTEDDHAMKEASSDDDRLWALKGEAMKDHFKLIEKSDAILVVNFEKRGIDNYVGANTLIEMGIALHHDKKIFLLNGVPEIACKEEILGMRPVVINGDLSLIRNR